MNITFRLVLVCTVICSASCIFTGSSNHADEKDSVRNGEIRIIFEPEANMFPENWYNDEIRGIAHQLDSSEHERTLGIIHAALSKYPQGFAEKYLRKIYVLGYLEFFGVEYGGTNTDGIVYISNRGEELGYTDLYLEQTFHHEFSSILFYANSRFFNHDAWISQNLGFTYGSGGVNAIRDGTASLKLSRHYARMGVLSEYGMSDIEEDFNTFAEQLFCPSPEFGDIAEHFPRVRKKLELIIQFYNNMDSVFTPEYFCRYRNE